jgi:hypothetical protein
MKNVFCFAAPLILILIKNAAALSHCAPLPPTLFACGDGDDDDPAPDAAAKMQILFPLCRINGSARNAGLKWPLNSSALRSFFSTFKCMHRLKMERVGSKSSNMVIFND